MRNGTIVLAGFAIVATGFAIFSLGAVLTPFLVGAIGAYIMDRPVSFLRKFKIPRAIGSFCAIAALVTFIGLLGAIAVPFIQNELKILSNNMPALMKHVYGIIDPALDFAASRVPPENIEHLKSQLSGQIGLVLSWGVRLVVNILSNGLAIANVLSLIVVTPVVMFYLTKDWPDILAYIKSALPEKYATTIVKHALRVDKSLAGYAKGQITVCAILAIMYAVGLSVIGLKNAVLIGVITGFLSFIPYLGALIGFTLSVVVHLSDIGTWNPITSIAMVFLAVQAIEGNFLTPRFVGGRIGAHPVIILFGLLAGASWFGFAGVVLALPVIAVVGSIIGSVTKGESLTADG